jgi:glycosyltransferase involved in cell wall biosynthesis
MHHAGKYFAYEIIKLKTTYDLILCSDMMNVAEFRGLLSALGESNSWFNKIQIITYFHENQITYPWSDSDPDPTLKRDNHYGWINYVSCLSSDFILFNSNFHKNSFIQALPSFINQFPNVPQNDFIDSISKKSSIIPIGLDLLNLSNLDSVKNEIPTILWNHRWEFDKNPELFFNILIDLKSKNIKFHLIIAGESYKNYPKVFDDAKLALSDRIIHFGFVENRSQYVELLLKSDIIPVTSNQDFFGISVIEAIAAGCVPILPNRLAFPEHLNQIEFQKYYYDSPDDLKSKLIQFIKEDHSSQTLRNYVLKYDFKDIGPVYDLYFSQVKS